MGGVKLDKRFIVFCNFLFLLTQHFFPTLTYVAHSFFPHSFFFNPRILSHCLNPSLRVLLAAGTFLLPMQVL